jgi:hypothetical protein
MSDGELSKEEIEALLAPSNADDRSESKITPLTQGEINHLLALINGKSTGSKMPTQGEINQLTNKLTAISDGRGPRAKTQILTQDEINQLLAALDASDGT